MTNLKCSKCGEPGLRQLRPRRHGFGRKFLFSCTKCGSGGGYDDVPAIVSTFGFAVFVPLFTWLGVELGKIGDVPQALRGVTIATVVIVGYAMYQVWARKRFFAAHPNAQP